MKRTLSFMVMALALLLTQCRKPEVKFPSPVAPEGTTVSMTVTAGPGSKTDITTAGGITWSTGDKLYVGYNGAYVGCLEIKNGQNTPTGWFSGNVTLPTGTENGEFHFFYLGSDNSVAPNVGDKTVSVSFATQEIYAEDGKLKNASKHHVGYGSAKGTVAGSEVTGINVTLVSKVALARFSFKKNSTDYTDALTLSGDHIYNSMTVGFNGEFNHGVTPGNITLTAGHAERYVMLVPTGDATEQTLTFTGSAEGGTGDVPGLESNKFYGKTGPIAVTLTATTIHVESVSLNKSTLSLEVGAYETLTATVLPDEATNKEVAWESDDTDVATVDDTGKVTAVAVGTATIKVTTEDGGKTAECAVTVTAPAPTTHVFSVGAGTTVEFSPGNLYWDGTESKFKFEANQWSFADTWNANHVSHFFWSKTASVAYAASYSESGTSSSDVFFTNSSSFQVAGETVGTWRTLSFGEWGYLLSTRANAASLRAWKQLDSSAHNGLVILPDGTENPSTVMGKIISTADLETYGAVFLPAANARHDTNVASVGWDGYYWSSTPNESLYAFEMDFWSNGVTTSGASRSAGYAVRLVR